MSCFFKCDSCGKEVEADRRPAGHTKTAIAQVPIRLGWVAKSDTNVAVGQSVYTEFCSNACWQKHLEAVAAKPESKPVPPARPTPPSRPVPPPGTPHPRRQAVPVDTAETQENIETGGGNGDGNAE